jgi:hypothetical protein
MVGFLIVTVHVHTGHRMYCSVPVPSAIFGLCCAGWCTRRGRPVCTRLSRYGWNGRVLVVRVTVYSYVDAMLELCLKQFERSFFGISLLRLVV